MSLSNHRHVLTISCPDHVGIVAGVSSFLAVNSANIIDSAQYGDKDTGLVFMRMHIEVDRNVCTAEELQQRFVPLAESFSMDWKMWAETRKAKLIIMVSRFGHCLNDLLYRSRTGALHADIKGVVSNHEDFRELAEWQGIPFYHMPITSDNKAEQEEKLLALVKKEQIDLVVLARYMQILSQDLCDKLHGRCIGIQHSFLPSFNGAAPYQQAYDRGVKLIGATAHYVTGNLAEGPIIEQGVERVDHSYCPSALKALGRDMECLVLARALNYHLERRVLVNGAKTVILR